VVFSLSRPFSLYVQMYMYTKHLSLLIEAIIKSSCQRHKVLCLQFKKGCFSSYTKRCVRHVPLFKIAEHVIKQISIIPSNRCDYSNIRSFQGLCIVLPGSLKRSSDLSPIFHYAYKCFSLYPYLCKGIAITFVCK
jgi:hypothetical protein